MSEVRTFASVEDVNKFIKKHEALHTVKFIVEQVPKCFTEPLDPGRFKDLLFSEFHLLFTEQLLVIFGRVRTRPPT